MSLINTTGKTIGAIFPVQQEHALRLFDHGDVFVKFTNLHLHNKFTIIFYVCGQKVMIGEARIKKIQKLDPTVAWSYYGDRIFLNEEEYVEYVSFSPVNKQKRKMKEITVLELENLRKYKMSVKSTYAITSSGRYLTKEMLVNIGNKKE
jgi:hypothetical protein